MEVQKEAQRIMTMSVWKMYHSRMQRGGLRLHRSLQLSLVMRNARDLYLSAKLEEEEEAAEGGGGGGGEGEMVAGAGERGARLAQEVAPAAQQEAQTPSDAEPEPMETQEEEEPQGGGGGEAQPLSRTPWTRGPAAKPSRKRRSSSLGKMGADDDAGLVPSKKAKLAEEEEEERPPPPPPQGQEGPFPSLARVLQDRFSGLILSTATATTPTATAAPEEPKGSCRQGEGVLSILVRAVVAF